MLSIGASVACSRPPVGRWRAGRSRRIRFPPEKIRINTKKKRPASVALQARGDTALLATTFWSVDYSTACARDARQTKAVLLSLYCFLVHRTQKTHAAVSSTMSPATIDNGR